MIQVKWEQICMGLIPNKTVLYFSARTFLHFVCCKSLNFGFLFQNRAKINVEILAFPIGRKCHYLSSSAERKGDSFAETLLTWNEGHGCIIGLCSLGQVSSTRYKINPNPQIKVTVTRRIRPQNCKIQQRKI